MLEDVAYLSKFFGLDPDAVMDWPNSKRLLWGPRVSKLIRMDRRVVAVENARANALAFFEPKDLVKLLKDDTESVQSVERSTRQSSEEIIARIEKIRRTPGSGSILDPNRKGAPQDAA